MIEIVDAADTGGEHDEAINIGGLSENAPHPDPPDDVPQLLLPLLYGPLRGVFGRPDLGLRAAAETVGDGACACHASGGEPT